MTYKWNVFIFVFLVSCSGKSKVQVTSNSNNVLQDVRIFKKDQTAMMQNATIGTIPFFFGGDKGISVLSIRWNQPVSSDNPGADCDLNYQEGNGTSHYFKCLVKNNESHIIVSIQEDLIEGRRLLRRVFMDSKGKELIDQWASALERIGYKKQSSKVPGSSVSYISPDSKTVADLIWASKLNSATLRISPKNESFIVK